jgi:hypothetical protein
LAESADGLREAWSRTWPAFTPKLVRCVGGSTAVVGWGGWVELLDAQGNTVRRRRFDQEIVAAGPVAGDGLRVRLADHRVLDWTWRAAP